MAQLTLTPDQVEQIKNDMYLTCKMLTDEQVMLLAKRVSEKYPLHVISGDKERSILFKIIHLIDKELYKVLPNEYYALIHNSADGISTAEAIDIKNRILPLIVNLIPMPFLLKALEEIIIGFVLELIINAMVKGANIEQV